MQVLIALALVGRALAQSWQTIAGYRTASDVKQQARIDLDMEELAHFVGNHDAEVTCDKSHNKDKGFCYMIGFGACNTDEASCTTKYWYPPGTLYEGCCFCEAGCDKSKETGTKCANFYFDSRDLAKICKYPAETWRADALSVYENGGDGLCTYDNENGVGCAVGDVKGNSVLSSGAIRTLKGFATKDYASETVYYTLPWPLIYAAYWDDSEWADTFITTDYSAIVKNVGWALLIEKGAYQAVWMTVLHELEDAVGDCYRGNITANDGQAHAWDEAWAFYAGSQVAATAIGAVTERGMLIWALAEKCGDDFLTVDSTGPATANVKALAQFIKGRDLIIEGECADVEPLVEEIRKQITIPLVQSVLKYAYKADPASANGDCTGDAANTAMTASDACVESWTDAWAFAAAVLPQVDQCSMTALARAEPEFPFISRGLTPRLSRRRRPRSKRTWKSRRQRRLRAASRRSRRRSSRRTRA